MLDVAGQHGELVTQHDDLQVLGAPGSHCEPGETCDGPDVGGTTCVDRGFSGGTLLCNATCDGFDESQCNSCGDGVVDAGEDCDDGNNVAGDGCDPNCQPELGDDIQGDTRDQAAALALGQVVESALNVGGDVDYYTFTTEAAGEYQVNTTGSTDTYCHLENGQGEDIATNDDGGEGLNCQLIEELEANTQYYLKVRGFNETRVGAYSVTVSYLTPPVCGNGQVERNEACDDGNNVEGDGCDATCSIEDDFGNDVDGAHAIQDPSTTEGNLIEDDMDFFRFTAAATGLRQIHTTGGTDTYCHLLDGQGNQIAADDDGGFAGRCLSLPLHCDRGSGASDLAPGGASDLVHGHAFGRLHHRGGG